MEMETEAKTPPGEVWVENHQGELRSSIRAGRHAWVADEPEKAGGTAAGPDPYDLLLAALGSCTAMTLRLYARHKKIPLERVEVRLTHSSIHAVDCAECEIREGKVGLIHRRIHLEGPLTEGQRTRLLEMADRCPVHRTLTGEITVRTSLE
jgi:putative redox protein